MARNKFYARKTLYNGFYFDSKAEASRYNELLLMSSKGMISELELQPEFEIIPPLYKDVNVKLKTKTKTIRKLEERSAKYHADFMYHDNEKDIYVIEEIKGKYLSYQKDYVLRRKLIKRKIFEMNKDAGFDKYIFVEIMR